MKLTATIQLPQQTQLPPFDLDLDIIPFDPAAVSGEGWKFEDKEGIINGLGDGVTSFGKTLNKAVAFLPSQKYEALKLLFPTGLSEDQTVITGEDRLRALADRFLADPDLGWSLCREEGQKTLKFLHDIFGVTWIGFLRRTLCNPSRLRFALYLYCGGDKNWSWSYRGLNVGCSAINPALSLLS